jgi:hypothetical protein
MADISEFSIVTYERRPECWRAAITRKGSDEARVRSRVRDGRSPNQRLLRHHFSTW